MITVKDLLEIAPNFKPRINGDYDYVDHSKDDWIVKRIYMETWATLCISNTNVRVNGFLQGCPRLFIEAEEARNDYS